MRPRSFTEEEKRKIGLRIRNIRIAHGMTMEELGASLIPGTTIAQSVVSRWERGLSVPNSKRLQALSQLGQITMDELLTGGEVSHDLKADTTPAEQSPLTQAVITTSDGSPFDQEQQHLLEALYLFFETYPQQGPVKELANFINTLNMGALKGAADSSLYQRLYNNAAHSLYEALQEQ